MRHFDEVDNEKLWAYCDNEMWKLVIMRHFGKIVIIRDILSNGDNMM
jgi:hypothetical protein